MATEDEGAGQGCRSHMSLEELKALVDSMDDVAHIVDRNLNVVYANAAGRRDFGQDYGSRKCYQYFHARSDKCPWCRHQDVFSGRAIRWQWQSVVNGRTYELIDIPIPGADGRIAFKLEIAKDVTQNKMLEDALLDMSRRYRAMVENAVEGIFRTTVEGRFLSVNPALAHLLGYASVDDLMAKDPMSSDLWVEPSQRVALLERLAKEGVVRNHEVLLRRVDRSTFWASISVRAMSGPGGGLGVLDGMVIDIDRRKRAELGLEQALAKSRAYFDLLAHDIANIITPVIINSELVMLDQDAPADARRRVSGILRQAQRAASLISDLRWLETVERLPEGENDQFDLSDQLPSVIEFVKAQYPAGSMTVRSSVPPGVRVAGGDHVRRVLTGIMDNSGRYAKEGGVVVGITVTEAGSGGARSWSIDVSDNGPGIPDARKGAIMPSLTSERDINRGVASSLQFYSLVLAHFGGSIAIGDRVPGDPDKGARVVITLPEAASHG